MLRVATILTMLGAAAHAAPSHVRYCAIESGYALHFITIGLGGPERERGYVLEIVDDMVLEYNCPRRSEDFWLCVTPPVDGEPRAIMSLDFEDDVFGEAFADTPDDDLDPDYWPMTCRTVPVSRNYGREPLN